MNFLFWLEPHFELAAPGIMATWLSWYERLASSLIAAEPSSVARIVALDTHMAHRKASLTGIELICLSQSELRADWTICGDPFMVLEHDSLAPDQLNHLKAILSRKLNGFEPEVVFLHNQQPWLRRLFPQALFVNIEVSWTARQPFPLSWHLDICGAGKGRVLAEYPENCLASIALTKEDGHWLDGICRSASDSLQSPGARDYVESLRHGGREVVLLPIGLFDRLDGNTGLFSILDEYFSKSNGSETVILTQHPMRSVVSEEQLRYWLDRYRWLADGRHWGSQTLIPLVDTVIGDFSTVATQVLFYGIKARSIKDRLRHFPKNTPLRNPLAELLQCLDPEKRQRMLLWLLRHYTVPEAKLFDVDWLIGFLRRARIASEAGQPWIAYQNSMAEVEDWDLRAWRIPNKQDSSESFASTGSMDIVSAPSVPESTAKTGSKVERKVQSMERKRQIDPVNEGRQYKKAEHLMKLGDTKAARKILEDLADRQATGWEIYNDLGSLRYADGDLDGAIAALRTAVNLELSSNIALRNLATVYVAADDIGNLLVVCQQLLRQDPDNQDFLLFLRDVMVSSNMRFDDVSWMSPRVEAEQLELVKARERISALEQDALALRDKSKLYDVLKPLYDARLSEWRTTWETIHALDTEAWLSALIAGIKTNTYKGYPLPKFPPDRLQTVVMGSSNENGLIEGFRYSKIVKSCCAKHGMPLGPDMRLLDFGTGWGRYPRIFMKDIRPENILGIDVDASLIEVCRNTYPDYGRFQQVPAFPPTELAEASFDLVTAYSVFSHLSEAAASAWIQEFARLLKPGGMIAVTTQGRSFLDYCEEIRQSGGDPNQPWHKDLARSFVDVDACRAAYDRGEHLFSATGSGEVRTSTFYGEALVPEGHVRNVWARWLEPLEFIDDRDILPQALIVMRKPA